MTDDELNRYETRAHQMASHIIAADVMELVAEVRRLREALAAAPRWVPVGEPPQNKTKPWEHIIARCNNGALISAVYDGEQWLEFDHELQEWIPLVNATHWYQVPTPGTEARAVIISTRG